MRPATTRCTLFPYTTLFRSQASREKRWEGYAPESQGQPGEQQQGGGLVIHVLIRRFRTTNQEYVDTEASDQGQDRHNPEGARIRSEEHTSELQSRENLVCRL